ncbi:TauD/TfdA family dioxygenase [Rhizobium herbae]|uniref:TauD/TfdA-like domain-containing protein n=1 Tax=Rhizobium herbae TaxID=508661 RepID=A0ABS4EUH3_9HYPH|nr:TauD/TfdA family dioxygenase [Rhizobium herbae]MBP1861573.1 hypothetical protein [Rhizobium herbae]
MKEPNILVLADTERDIILDLVETIQKSNESLLPLDFAVRAALYAGSLPFPVREFFAEFRTSEKDPAIIVRGNPQFEEKPTPPQILPDLNSERLSADEILHLLYGSLLGDAFTWRTIQFGNLINNVLPIKGNEALPISSGSKNLFDLHTEDAFHENAGEYFGLYCLRNDERASTILSFIDDIDIAAEHLPLLFSPSFRIAPNIAHSVVEEKVLQGILFGSKSQPYIKANLNYLEGGTTDHEHADALAALVWQLNEVKQDVILERGDALYIDNYRTLHGRAPYEAKYDGTGRWLKRIYISGSIRRSRKLRAEARSRIVEGEEA